MPENTTTIPVKRGRGRPRKVDKLQTLDQSNGKVETPATIRQITSLDETWGGNTADKFGTIDEAKYVADLRQMTNVDLANQARKHGVMFTMSAPNPYERVRELLLKEFRMYISSLNRPQHRPSTIIVPPDVQNTLNQGR